MPTARVGPGVAAGAPPSHRACGSPAHGAPTHCHAVAVAIAGFARAPRTRTMPRGCCLRRLRPSVVAPPRGTRGPCAKGGPFARRALCCHPCPRYYDPPPTPDVPSDASAFLGSSARSRERADVRSLQLRVHPSNHSAPSTPGGRNGSSSRSSPSLAVFAQAFEARPPHFCDDAAGFTARCGLVGCREPSPARGVGPLRDAPSGRVAVIAPSALRGSARFPASHTLR